MPVFFCFGLLGSLAVVALIISFVLAGILAPLAFMVIGGLFALAVFLVITSIMALGLVSSSFLVACIQRSITAGLRALILQLSVLAGVLAGISILWTLQYLTGDNWNVSTIVIIGGLSGAFAGLLLALSFNWVWGQLAKMIISRIDSTIHAKPE